MEIMMTQKEKKLRAKKAVEVLKERYPDATCALEYEGDPWRLLVMGRLSAQCTDARVNIVCKELFRRFPDAKSMAEAPVEELATEISHACTESPRKFHSINMPMP